MEVIASFVGDNKDHWLAEVINAVGGFCLYDCQFERRKALCR